ncbi:MAG: alkylhydroperoxidase [SAR324 cluster bacterium]|nr:alkylhydroperoxidase [SAR324 cluster bacterium]
MSSWIEMLPVEDATGPLKDAYDLAKTPAGTVDNVMRVHSQRPHTMVGHLTLYRSVLHHADNTLPLWFLEAVGVYTSLRNECEYSFTHHCANMRRLLKDDERSDAIETALREQTPEFAFSGKELALMRYTGKLTSTPGKVEAADVEAAKTAGATDGEILEVNQVCAYFCYSNRTLNGLGVTLAGDTVGFYSNSE